MSLNYSDKSNTPFESVKGKLLFVYTHNVKLFIKEVRTTTYSELVFILQPGTAASDQCSFFPPSK